MTAALFFNVSHLIIGSCTSHKHYYSQVIDPSVSAQLIDLIWWMSHSVGVVTLQILSSRTEWRRFSHRGSLAQFRHQTGLVWFCWTLRTVNKQSALCWYIHWHWLVQSAQDESAQMSNLLCNILLHWNKLNRKTKIDLMHTEGLKFENKLVLLQSTDDSYTAETFQIKKDSLFQILHCHTVILHPKIRFRLSEVAGWLFS